MKLAMKSHALKDLSMWFIIISLLGYDKALHNNSQGIRTDKLLMIVTQVLSIFREEEEESRFESYWLSEEKLCR